MASGAFLHDWHKFHWKLLQALDSKEKVSVILKTEQFISLKAE